MNKILSVSPSASVSPSIRVSFSISPSYSEYEASVSFPPEEFVDEFWACAFCVSVNLYENLECRKCGAPRGWK